MIVFFLAGPVLLRSPSSVGEMRLFLPGLDDTKGCTRCAPGIAVPLREKITPSWLDPKCILASLR